MTITYHQTGWLPIGAWELKHCYQRNMRNAVLLVLGAFAATIASVALIAKLSLREVPQSHPRVVDVAHLSPPPTLIPRPMQALIELISSAPRFTLPEAVEDELVSDDPVIVSQEELAEMTAPAIGDGEGTGNAVVQIPVDWDTLPSSGQFVAYDEIPMILSQPQPKYPELARRAEIEGVVRVEVLVDKKGDVRDARVLKGSGANAGFEEAALEAARLARWRPAMQNNTPVATWVWYDIKFRLK